MFALCNSHESDTRLLVNESAINFKDYRNQIVVNQKREGNASGPISVFNRSNKSSVFFYFPSKNRTHIFWRCRDCKVPKFFKDRNQTLFSQILGVVPYEKAPADNYLILFNISHRPKYCITGRTEVWHNFDFEFN